MLTIDAAIKMADEQKKDPITNQIREILIDKNFDGKSKELIATIHNYIIEDDTLFHLW